MNWFNLSNKNNDSLSSAQKDFLELKKQNDLNLPTTEEAIEAIVEEFTPEQLDVLEITSQLGRKISFKDQLDAFCGHFHPIYHIQTIKEKLRFYIQKYKKAFNDKDMANDLFLDRCKELFKNSN